MLSREKEKEHIRLNNASASMHLHRLCYENVNILFFVIFVSWIVIISSSFCFIYTSMSRLVAAWIISKKRVSNMICTREICIIIECSNHSEK